jgi:DNA-binding NtrC family response regulator
MSGYSPQVLAPEALADQGAATFIEKPFNADQLLGAVQRLFEPAGRNGHDER